MSRGVLSSAAAEWLDVSLEAVIPTIRRQLSAPGLDVRHRGYPPTLCRGRTERTVTDTSPVHVCRRLHPSWCDPGECETYPASGRAPTFVLHAVILRRARGRCVELLQREIIDARTVRAVQREPARIIVSRDGCDELVLHAEKAEDVGIVITRAAAVSQQDGR
jgi:hypothetical protein